LASKIQKRRLRKKRKATSIVRGDIETNRVVRGNPELIGQRRTGSSTKERRVAYRPPEGKEVNSKPDKGGGRAKESSTR